MLFNVEELYCIVYLISVVLVECDLEFIVIIFGEYN